MWMNSLATALAVLASGSAQAGPKIGIVVFDHVLATDVTAPLEVFGAATRTSWFASYEVLLISLTDERTIRTHEGFLLTADTTLSALGETPLDVLIMPSAYDMSPVLENEALLARIRAQAESGGWLASNCSGAYALASAGVLEGRQATTWAGDEKRLQSQFSSVRVAVDRNVVFDGRLVTSNGGVVSYQAALLLLARLTSETKAREVHEALALDRLVSWRELQVAVEGSP